MSTTPNLLEPLFSWLPKGVKCERSRFFLEHAKIGAADEIALRKGKFACGKRSDIFSNSDRTELSRAAELNALN